MENINILDLEELNELQLRNVTGGGFFVIVAAGITIAAAAEIISDWDNFKRGLRNEPRQ